MGSQVITRPTEQSVYNQSPNGRIVFDAVRGPLIFEFEDAATNSVTDLLTLRHFANAAPAIGMGVGLLLQLEDSAGATENAGRLAAVWTDPTNGNETSEVRTYARSAGGALTESFRATVDGVGVGATPSTTTGFRLSRAARDAIYLAEYTAGAGNFTAGFNSTNDAGKIVYFEINSSGYAGNLLGVARANAGALVAQNTKIIFGTESADPITISTNATVRTTYDGATGNMTHTSRTFLPNGTAAAPALSWTNSTGMGWFRQADNVLGIAIAGAEVSRWNANGLGIGGVGATGSAAIYAQKTAPGTTNGALFEHTDASGSTNLAAQNNSGNVLFMGIRGSAFSGGGTLLGVLQDNNSFVFASGGALILGTSAATAVTVSTNNTLRWTWSSAGLVTHNVADAVTAAMTDIFTLDHLTSGAAAVGYGSAFLYTGEDAAGNAENMGRAGVIWTDATNGSEDSAFVWQTRTNGAALAEVARFGDVGTSGLGLSLKGDNDTGIVGLGGDALRIICGDSLVMQLDQSGGLLRIGVFGVGPVVRQTGGANLTNNVTAGGVNDTIADFTATVAGDAGGIATVSAAANVATVASVNAQLATIRNDIYQLARTLKQDHDALRAYGYLT